jgi:YD repeat-containing protein
LPLAFTREGTPAAAIAASAPASSDRRLSFGPTRGWTWGNSTLAIREYDTDGKITDIDSAGLKTYSYDDAFRITGITDATNSSLSQAYGYDLLDRLTSATGTSLNQGWTYDANGNRLTQTGSAASTYTVSSTSNRLSSVSGALSRAYGYDTAGNTTSDGTATFTYNDAWVSQPFVDTNLS